MTLADENAEARPFSYSWLLTARREELAHFRRLASLAMREWHQPARVTEVVLHGVTELLSNVARHVDDPRCTLTLDRDGSAVRVTVHDRSPALPKITLPEWSAEEGRGLWLLREMADGLGCVPTEEGKQVWVRVGTSPSEF